VRARRENRASRAEPGSRANALPVRGASRPDRHLDGRRPGREPGRVHGTCVRPSGRVPLRTRGRSRDGLRPDPPHRTNSESRASSSRSRAASLPHATCTSYSTSLVRNRVRPSDETVDVVKFTYPFGTSSRRSASGARACPAEADSSTPGHPGAVRQPEGIYLPATRPDSPPSHPP